MKDAIIKFDKSTNHYSDEWNYNENGRIVNKNVDGKVTRYRYLGEDSMINQNLEYDCFITCDSNGHILHEKNIFEQTTTRIAYNDLNQCVNITIENENFSSNINYIYEDNLLIKKVTKSIWFNTHELKDIITKYKYNEDRKLTHTSIFVDDICTSEEDYKYDNNGNVIIKTKYTGVDKSKITIYAYLYDNNNRLIFTEHIENDKTLDIINYTYNDNIRYSEKRYLFKENEQIELTTEYYDIYGNISYKIKYTPSYRFYEHTFYYYQNGLLTRKVYFDCIGIK